MQDSAAITALDLGVMAVGSFLKSEFK